MNDLAPAPLPGPPGQRLLFSDEIELEIQKMEEREGRYTGERFKVRRPEAYKAAVELLGAGVGMLKIGRLLGVHHLTIAAVRDSEQEAIDIANQTIGKLDIGINLLIDRILEHPGLVPWASIGMTIDQLVRNRELLAGRATSRGETIDRIDIHADWDRILQTFVSEKELGPGEVFELGLGNGFERSEIPPIAAAPIEAGGSQGEGKPDEESDAQQREQPADLTTNLTKAAPDEARPACPTEPLPPADQDRIQDAELALGLAAIARGGGGVEPVRNEPPDPTQPASQKISDNAVQPTQPDA